MKLFKGLEELKDDSRYSEVLVYVDAVTKVLRRNFPTARALSEDECKILFGIINNFLNAIVEAGSDNKPADKLENKFIH